ncbi:dihydropteroate synthase [Psychroflexus aestuariivivens]|uniref:dihydropteroate synthase n=1 Tax=Psychroflexus aestuariivivens TaxID=1795040 RepID=UPI000FDC44D6|nr:dihydropteroate synthase [Psychroflexus aestuariivivens]
MTINCGGQLLDLNTPKIMAILNLTPDSFYDGGKFKENSKILNLIEKNIQNGMDILDIGAYSSKPNAVEVSVEEEKQRLLPVLTLIRKEFPEIIISIDTFRASVAAESIDIGAQIINDISAGNLDSEMMKTIAEFQVPYIMMHMRGTPQNMNTFTNYENLEQDILFYFSEKINEARKLGINDLILDPGLGFAKTANQNFQILNHLSIFKNTDLPILIGLSRKSMIYKSLDITAKDALNGTTALNMAALMNGANILRVHDVLEAKQCVTLFNEMKHN